MIVLDLEWNRGYDRTPLDEILQIGAVRIDQLGGPVLDTFNVYIRPVVHKKFDPGAKQLPELQASRKSDLSFVEAMKLFRAWCGTETEFAVWGGDDLAALTKNCEFWNTPAPVMEKVYNFQFALSYLLDTNQQIALWRAVGYFGIPDIFTFHNALNDAMYTALISRWLTLASLNYQPPRRKKQVKCKVRLKLSNFPFSQPPRQTLGPFQTAEAVLDARTGRRPPCPICGRKGCISQWRSAPPKDGQPRFFFSVFSCPKHGRFLCRMALSRLENGRWRGRLTVPVIQPGVIKEYAAAYQGSIHTCKSIGQNNHRPRRNKSS